MPFQTISLKKQGSVAHLALQRPDDSNTINEKMLRELADACTSIADDDEVRATILSGGSSNSFSIGWDHALLTDTSSLPGDVFAPLASLPQPLICAIHGDSISGGLELALACDIRIAAEGSRFGLPETSLGLVPMAGGSQRLARAVGQSWALAMVLTANPIDAQEALRIGLISQLLPRQKLLAEAQAIAETVAQRGPIAVRYAKEAVTLGLDMTLEQAMRYELDLSVILQTTEDRAEGLQAFREKRRPNFHGR